jgi:hypothetical protein
MEVTCWHCRAVFDPTVIGKRCPYCGHHPEAWLAKFRFAAIDFIGPGALVALVVSNFKDDPAISAMFVIGAVVWAIFILYEDVSDWVPTSGALLVQPPMPESWKQSPALHGTRLIDATSSPGLGKRNQASALPRTSGLTGAEQLLIAVLASALIAYGALHWNEIASFRSVTHIPVTSVAYAAVFGGLIVYSVRRTSFEKEVLRDGVLTTGVLAGWYDKSSYTRTGYQKYIRIRYYFWTESGQKFEGSGTLIGGFSADDLSINQEPLKVFYLPQDPSKNVALCCTTSWPQDRTGLAFPVGPD